MTKTPTDSRLRRVPQRIPPSKISLEEKAKQEVDSEARYQKAKTIFKRVRDELINENYNWYITIDPDTEEYFLSQDDLEVLHKIKEKHLEGKVTSFRLNETGVCGRL